MGKLFVGIKTLFIKMIEPNKLIKALRNSDNYIETIFMNGSCYKFHLFLKSIYPKSKAFIHVDGDHIVTKINGSLFDIRGKIDSKFKCFYKPLHDEDIEIVKKWSFHANNLLKITECPACDEPICV